MKSAVLKKRAPATERAAPKKAPQLFAVPTIAKGEIWAGPIFKEDGTLDYHLIVLPGEFEGKHAAAVAWAKKQGGELPNRREARLLWVNAAPHFNKARWYWTSERHRASSDYAYVQNFVDGIQSLSSKDSRFLARAVRREPIQ